MPLTKPQLITDLRALGLTEGMVVMAHVALSAFGRVEGGPDTIIEALAEVVGESGTLCMPAMASEQPFRVESSPSNVGAVTERFRSWPGVKRGLHPTHSASCLGPLADELLAGHDHQPTALGPESPRGRIAQRPDGYVLLMGCDQDRNTLLHSAEEAVDAPYLSPIQRTYVDEQGEVQTIALERFPGPHRDFIGLDHMFRKAGIMRTGKVGSAVCRLMHAGQTLALATDALREDPAAVLCDNPCCNDCVRQRADITRHRLAQEDFTLTALVDEVGLPFSQFAEALDAAQRQGIDTVELGADYTAGMLALSRSDQTAAARDLAGRGVSVWTVTCPEPAAVAATLALAQTFGARLVKLPALPAEDLREAVRLADASGLGLVVENAPGTAFDTKERCEALLADVPGLGLAFNPAHFAQVGECPFLKTYYKGRLKRAVRQLYIADGCRPGGEPFTLPGRGQGEVKELISILRCRSFDGALCLKMGNRTGKDEFIRQAQSFWALMERL